MDRVANGPLLWSVVMGTRSFSVNRVSSRQIHPRHRLAGIGGFPKEKAGEGLPVAERPENLLKHPVALGLEAPQKMSEPPAELPDQTPHLLERKRKRETNLVGKSPGLHRGEDSPQVPGREGAPEGILQNLVRLPKRGSDHECVAITVESGPRQATLSQDDPDRGPLVQVQVPADVPEADAKKDGAGEGAEPGPPEDPEGQIETVRPEGSMGFLPPERGVRRSPQEMVHMGQGGLVHPIQDDELGTQVELLHLGTTEVHNLSGGSELPVQDQRQPDVLDPSLRVIGLVDVPVLDHGTGEGQLANAGNLGHGLRPGIWLWRGEIWGQLRHVEPVSVDDLDAPGRDSYDNHLFTGVARIPCRQLRNLPPLPRPDIFETFRRRPGNAVVPFNPESFTLDRLRRRSVGFLEREGETWACFLVTFRGRDSRWHGYFSFRPKDGEVQVDEVRTADIFLEASEPEIDQKARGLGRPLLSGLLSSALHTMEKTARDPPKLRRWFRTMLTRNSRELAGGWPGDGSGAHQEMDLGKLRSMYASYRLDQVCHFIALVEPEDFKRTVDRILEGQTMDFGGKDVLQFAMMVVEFIEDRLPLPPFEVWVEDFLRFREEYALYAHTLHREGRLP